GLPGHIVEAKASGCVWADTAEEEWGFTEEELDRMVQELDKGVEAVLADPTISESKKRAFIKMNKESLHKRKFYPIWRNHG
ncbi:MAG: hypothetical protein D6732_09580, partial [Methanobacteriota archaeon]